MLSFLHDERGGDVDDSAPDRPGRLDREIQVFDLVVDVAAVQVDGCGGDRGDLSEDGRVDEFAGLGRRYQRMTPSPTASKISFSWMGRRFLMSLSSLSTSLTWFVKAER